MNGNQKTFARWFNPFVYGGGGVVALLSLMTIVELWVYGVWKVLIFPWPPLMNLNAALCLFGCSIGIILERLEMRRATAIIGLSVGGFAALFAVQDYFETDFDIGNLFTPAIEETPFFERMGLNSALCFVVCGFALWTNNYLMNRQNRPFVVGVAGAFIVSVALVAFIGHITGIQSAYRWDAINGMSLATSLSLIIIGVSFIVSTWKMQMENEIMSYFFWISVPVNICIIVFTIFLWLALKNEQIHNERQAQLVRSVDINQDIQMEIDINSTELHLHFLVLLGFIMVSFVTAVAYYAQSKRSRSLELEKAINQLRRAQVALIQQENLASLGTLTAGIAHEVKNPLNIMKSFSDLSLDLVNEISDFVEKNQSSFKEEDREGIKEALGTLKQNLTRICEQGKRAHNTVQRMLSHARGKQEISVTDIHSLLDEYLTLSYHGMRAQYPEFNAKIIKKYDLDIPKLNVIAEDMSRVFLNMFNNAYYELCQKKKLMGDAFDPELIVSTTKIGDALEIRIRDNGPGIGELSRTKIFTPFFTTKPVGQGTGLGLSLSHNIVQEHGGTMDFSSKEGDYTEFVITLPIKKSEQIPVSEWELVHR